MSSNRLIYDECAKSTQEKIDENQLKWVLDSGRYINEKTCVVDEPFFGKAGNTINNNKYSNRVDLETKLWGISNIDSKCKTSNNITYEPQNNDVCNFFNIENNDLSNSDNTLTNKTCS